MPAIFTEEFINEVIERNDLVSVVGTYVQLKKSASRHVGLCPFHNEKTPSFTVSENLQLYYCFGCHKGGNVISFVEDIENFDFIESVKFLAQRAGMTIPEDDGSLPHDIKLKNRILALNKEAAKYFHNQLMSDSGKFALEYFTKRGLTKNTIIHYGLGYAKNESKDLYRYLTGLYYSKNEIFEAGLCGLNNDDAYDFFKNRIMFPVMDIRGNVIGFGGRALDDNSGPKYLNTKETPVFIKRRNLYNMNFAKNSIRSEMILVEGYMDVIALFQAGFDNAVASLGTAFCEEHAKLLKRFSKKVVLSYDADTAGQTATDKVTDILLKEGINPKIAVLRGGKDPDEIIKSFGSDYYKLILDEAKTSFEYKLDKLKSNYNLEQTDQKIEFSKSAAQILVTIYDPIEREIYIQKLSDELNLPKDVIISSVKRYHTKIKKQEEVKSTYKSVALKSNRKNNAELELLNILIKYPSHCKNLFELIDESLLDDDTVKECITKIKEQISQGQALDIQKILNTLPDDQKAQVFKLVMKDTVYQDVKKAAVSVIDVIKSEKNKGDLKGENDLNKLNELIKNMGDKN